MKQALSPSKLQAIRRAQSQRRIQMLLKLSAKFGRICWYCQTPVLFRDAHVDHIVPKSQGGSNKMENLAIACTFCNRAKWDKPLEEFLQWLSLRKIPLPYIKDRAKAGPQYWNDLDRGFRKV